MSAGGHIILVDCASAREWFKKTTVQDRIVIPLPGPTAGYDAFNIAQPSTENAVLQLLKHRDSLDSCRFNLDNLLPLCEYNEKQVGNTCTSCSYGKQCVNGVEEICEPGYECKNGEATQCAGTTVPAHDDSSCIECPAGNVCDLGLTSNCFNEKPDSTKKLCVPCGSGKRCVNGVEEICPDGLICAGGMSTSCGLYKMCSNGVQSDCLLNSMCVDGKSELCTKGFQCIGNTGEPTACPLNQMCLNGKNETCTEGFQCIGNKGNTTVCPGDYCLNGKNTTCPSNSVCIGGFEKGKCSIDGFNVIDGVLTRKTGSEYEYFQHCTALDLAGQGIDSIGDDCFHNMSKLEYLDLQNNNITSLAPGALDGAPLLELGDNLLLDAQTKCTGT
eukprot:Pgem_evm1s1692